MGGISEPSRHEAEKSAPAGGKKERRRANIAEQGRGISCNKKGSSVKKIPLIEASVIVRTKKNFGQKGGGEKVIDGLWGRIPGAMSQGESDNRRGKKETATMRQSITLSKIWKILRKRGKRVSRFPWDRRELQVERKNSWKSRRTRSTACRKRRRLRKRQLRVKGREE